MSKEYKMIHPESGEVIHVDVPDGTKAHDTQYKYLLIAFWKALSKGPAMGVPEQTAIILALQEFDISFEEAYSGLWKAYADYYVSNGDIQFRHMWKWIDKKRKAQAGISYHEALRRWHEKGNPGEFTEHFKSFIDRNGTRLWRPTNEE